MTFFRKIVLPGFWGLGCHPSILIDLANTALASKGSGETICKILQGCKIHRVVTGPMNFKKIRIFFGKSCSRNFGDPGCHPGTLIDFVNTGLDNRGSVKPICMISEGYRTHRGVTGPMNFKEKGRFFRKIVLPGF